MQTISLLRTLLYYLLRYYSLHLTERVYDFVQSDFDVFFFSFVLLSKLDDFASFRRLAGDELIDWGDDAVFTFFDAFDFAQLG